MVTMDAHNFESFVEQAMDLAREHGYSATQVEREIRAIDKDVTKGLGDVVAHLEGYFGPIELECKKVQ